MSDRRRRKASGIVSPIAFAAFPCSYADSGMNVLITLKRRRQLMANLIKFGRALSVLPQRGELDSRPRWCCGRAEAVAIIGSGRDRKISVSLGCDRCAPEMVAALVREVSMTVDSTIAGGCLCGAVRFEAHGEPTNMLLCHCRMCQRASGAPFSALMFMSPEQIAVTKGKTRAVSFSPRTWRHICDSCASPIFFTREARLDIQAIYVGALDNPSGFKPRMHVCASSAMTWLDIQDDAPRYDEKPPNMTQTLRYDPKTGVAEIPEMGGPKEVPPSN
ncbi:MAG: GFA family protein [Geminicoccaceae bacterium]